MHWLLVKVPLPTNYCSANKFVAKYKAFKELPEATVLSIAESILHSWRSNKQT